MQREALPDTEDGPYIIGIDVGTGSVRAALFTKTGALKNVASKSIKTWNPRPEFYEQSSTDIWESTCCVVKELMNGCSPESIVAIGVDATCSLVALDSNHEPISVSLTGNKEQNVILWMDHRATDEAEIINQTKHRVLSQVGGKISVEMEIPKILWLKNNLQESYNKVGLFLELPDFLTWKMTGSESRSMCSLVCKWTYEVTSRDNHGWNAEFFEQIGLSDLASDGWKKIGQEVKYPGSPCGEGLSSIAAAELGLKAGTPVATSIIDAHAGGVGMIGWQARRISEEFSSRLCVIAGTSTCHMAVSKESIFIQGIWGPYFSAMIPNLYLNEAGQSAAGKLLDHIIDTHPATPEIRKKLEARNSTLLVQDYLHNILTKMAEEQGLPGIAMLTKDIHVYPDFHGNRSPLADPSLRGMISGLSLATDEENLAVIYLATVQALAYSSRHILQVLKTAGHKDIKSLIMCGGLSHNFIYVETHADVLGIPVLSLHDTESVMLGAAILGAAAGGIYKDVKSSIHAMSGHAAAIYPRPVENRYHMKKYSIFEKMVEHQCLYKQLMATD